MTLEKVIVCARFVPAENIGVVPGVVIRLCHPIFHTWRTLFWT